MYAVGTPILQSASSTILGVSFLSSTESYVFSSFFKTIILVIILGVLHGLVILPVLLTIFSSDKQDTSDTESKQSSTKEVPPSDAFNQLRPAFTPYHLYRQPYILKPHGRRVSTDSSTDPPIHYNPAYGQIIEPATSNMPAIPPRLNSYGPNLLRPEFSFQTLPYFSNSANFVEAPNATEYFVPVQTIVKSSNNSGGMAH